MRAAHGCLTVFLAAAAGACASAPPQPTAAAVAAAYDQKVSAILQLENQRVLHPAPAARAAPRPTESATGRPQRRRWTFHRCSRMRTQPSAGVRPWRLAACTSTKASRRCFRC